MIKLLLGGSPCTNWSIAKRGRETEPQGEGWELFKCYLAAKEVFKPDYFLYENNKSVKEKIKDQISEELGVELNHINSALVSAQNRERFYAYNIPDVSAPKDRGILLRDVIEDVHEIPVNTMGNCKSKCLRTVNGCSIRDWIGNDHDTRTCIAKPIRIGQTRDGKQDNRVYSIDGKSVCLKGNAGGAALKRGCMRFISVRMGSTTVVSNTAKRRR